MQNPEMSDQHCPLWFW